MTLKTLMKINPYITDYGLDVDEADVEIANKAIRKMYRKPQQLAAGDVVEFTNEYGDYSARAIVERIDGDCVSICQSGSVWASNSKNYVSVSGGSFYTVPKAELIYIGRAKRYFSEWGRFGACARGAIKIPVTVNLWRNKTDLEYTTEFFNRHYIYKYSEDYKNAHNCRYDYGEICKQAWTNNETLSAWCYINKAFIDKKKMSGDGINVLVWTYKDIEHYWCNDEEVLKMDGFHDFKIMNGAVRNVCYVYDDEKKSVDVYFGTNDLSDRTNCYRNWDKRNYENSLKVVRENNLHFPESFIRG